MPAVAGVSRRCKPQQSLKTWMREQGWGPEGDLSIHHSICGQVSSRDDRIREFAAGFDLVIFVSSRKSSNGRVLFAACKEVNPHAFFVSSPEESDELQLEGVSSIGICGATSTPMWLLTAVNDRISARLNIT